MCLERRGSEGGNWVGRCVWKMMGCTWEMMGFRFTGCVVIEDAGDLLNGNGISGKHRMEVCSFSTE